MKVVRSGRVRESRDVSGEVDSDTGTAQASASSSHMNGSLPRWSERSGELIRAAQSIKKWE